MDGGGAGAGSRVKVVGQVERVDGWSLTYPKFVDRFMKPNLPVVLTSLTSSWRSCEDWTLAGPNDRRHPNLDFFAQNFPSPLVQVQVADCSSREFTDQKRLDVSMQEFVDHWVGSSCTGSSNGDCEGSLLYLKDWHFVKDLAGWRDQQDSRSCSSVCKSHTRDRNYLKYCNTVFNHWDWILSRANFLLVW